LDEEAVKYGHYPAWLWLGLKTIAFDHRAFRPSSRAMPSAKQEAMMFVVKPLMEDADLRAFLSLAAANEYAETGVFQDCGCEQSEIHFVDGEITADEAVAAVKDGRSEKRTIVRRRMSADEIEVSRLDALAERELGL
jgi:hypothetical protein